MKRSIMVCCLAVLLLIALVGCQKANNNPLTEDIFKITVEKQFNQAKDSASKLEFAKLFDPPIDATPVLFPQPDPGNAGELYWNVLKDRIDPRTEAAQKLVDQMTPVVQVFELALREKDKVKLTPATLDAVKDIAPKAAEMPELAEFEKGAKRKNFRLVGELIQVPDNIMALPTVPPAVLKSYTAAMMCKALLKEAAGDKAAAESEMQAIIAVGQHFSQDANYLHYFSGLSAMSFGCLGLKQFYQRENNAAKQQAVEQLEKSIDEQTTRLNKLTAKDEANQPFNILNSLGFLDEGVDKLANIAGDEKVPPGFRAKVIENIFSGYMFRYFMAEKSGRPAETTEYAPPSDQRIQALQKLSQLPDKALGQIAGKAEATLTKMKGMNSGDRMKYWHEMSKPKA